MIKNTSDFKATEINITTTEEPVIYNKGNIYI